MKKVLSLIIVMNLLIASYGQKVDSLSNLPDTAKLTLTKVYSDVKSGISALAQSLKVPAAHVYEIIVKQQLTYSVINICLVLGLLIFCLLTARYAKLTYKGHIALYKQRTEREDADLDDTAKGPLSVALCIISILLGIATVIVFCVTIQQTIIGFTNPEYGAIKEIISFVK